MTATYRSFSWWRLGPRGTSWSLWPQLPSRKDPLLLGCRKASKGSHRVTMVASSWSSKTTGWFGATPTFRGNLHIYPWCWNILTNIYQHFTTQSCKDIRPPRPELGCSVQIREIPCLLQVQPRIPKVIYACLVRNLHSHDISWYPNPFLENDIPGALMLKPV